MLTQLAIGRNPRPNRHLLEEVRARNRQERAAGQERARMPGKLRRPILGCEPVDDEAPWKYATKLIGGSK